jgi:SUMO ligase MMS21 Smc5/6 complex component
VSNSDNWNLITCMKMASPTTTDEVVMLADIENRQCHTINITDLQNQIKDLQGMVQMLQAKDSSNSSSSFSEKILEPSLMRATSTPILED